jgi:hypothetical protein
MALAEFLASEEDWKNWPLSARRGTPQWYAEWAFENVEEALRVVVRSPDLAHVEILVHVSEMPDQTTRDLLAFNIACEAPYGITVALSCRVSRC